MLQLTHSAWEVLDARMDDSRPELDALLERLKEVDNELHLDIEAAVNDHVSTMVKQAFRIGFEAAHNPAPFIFECAASQTDMGVPPGLKERIDLSDLTDI